MSKKMRSIVRQRRREVQQKRRKRGESVDHVADDNSAIENALMDVAHMMQVGGVGVTCWEDGDEVFLLVRASQHDSGTTLSELVEKSKGNQEEQDEPEPESPRPEPDIRGENQTVVGEGVEAPSGGD